MPGQILPALRGLAPAGHMRRLASLRPATSLTILAKAADPVIAHNVLHSLSKREAVGLAIMPLLTGQRSEKTIQAFRNRLVGGTLRFGAFGGADQFGSLNLN